MRIVVLSKIIFYLCMLFSVYSCGDSVLTIRDVELKQDIRTDGILDLSSYLGFPVAPSEINIRFKPNRYWTGLGAAEKFGVRFGNRSGEYIDVGYDTYHEILYINGGNPSPAVSTEASAEVDAGRYSIDEAEVLEMKIRLKKASVELSTMDGEIVLSNTFRLSSKFDKLLLYAENGKIFVECLSVKKLK